MKHNLNVIAQEEYHLLERIIEMKSKNELTPKELAEKEKYLANYNGPDKIISSHEMMQKIMAENVLDIKIDTGYPSLEKHIKGIVPGQLIVVSGQTGSGKTLFLQSLTRNITKQNFRVCWFSYELPPKQFLFCFPQLPAFYAPEIIKESDLMWLEERTWEAMLKYDIKVVMIDHLHYLVDMAKDQNISWGVGRVLRKLKRLAIEHNIVVFLICHTGKKDRIEKKVELSGDDIRDSSFCTQEPDTVLMIWRTKDELDRVDEAVIKIEKSRLTGVQDKLFTVKKIKGYLEELKFDTEPDDADMFTNP